MQHLPFEFLIPVSNHMRNDIAARSKFLIQTRELLLQLYLFANIVSIEHCSSHILLTFHSFICLWSSFKNLLRNRWDTVGIWFLLYLLFIHILFNFDLLLSEHVLNMLVIWLNFSRDSLWSLPLLRLGLKLFSFSKSVAIHLFSYKLSASIDKNFILVFHRWECSILLSAINIKSDGLEALLAYKLISGIFLCVIPFWFIYLQSNSRSVILQYLRFSIFFT